MTLRRLAGDTLIYGSGYILGRVLNYLLITIYLTWKFDYEEEQYGLYTDFYFYVALVLVLLTLRMETTFFRYGSEKSRYQAIYSQASLMLVGTASAWIVFVAFFKNGIARFLQYPGFETHVMVLGLIIALDVLVAIPFASLRLEQRPIRFAALKVGGILINIGSVLFFLEILPYMAEHGSEWAAGFYRREDRLLYVFIANLIASATVFLLFAGRYLKLKLKWTERYFGRMLRYTWPLILVGIAGVINQSSYITFQKYILPDSLTENLATGGVYAAATRIAILMSLFITAFNYAAEPFFFQQAKQENHRETYADVARAFAIAGSILMAGIVLYLDVIELIIGTSFRENMHYVPILLTAFFLLGLYYNFSIWYKLTDPDDLWRVYFSWWRHHHHRAKHLVNPDSGSWWLCGCRGGVLWFHGCCLLPVGTKILSCTIRDRHHNSSLLHVIDILLHQRINPGLDGSRLLDDAYN